jgi:hypothetical protein
MGKYRVTGRLRMFGHEPGTVFERDLPAKQEERHIRAGRLEKVRADTKTTEERQKEEGT